MQAFVCEQAFSRRIGKQKRSCIKRSSCRPEAHHAVGSGLEAIRTESRAPAPQAFRTRRIVLCRSKRCSDRSDPSQQCLRPVRRKSSADSLSRSGRIIRGNHIRFQMRIICVCYTEKTRRLFSHGRKTKSTQTSACGTKTDDDGAARHSVRAGAKLSALQRAAGAHAAGSLYL